MCGYTSLVYTGHGDNNAMSEAADVIPNRTVKVGRKKKKKRALAKSSSTPVPSHCAIPFNRRGSAQLVS